jgi:hypothetical protein
VQVWQTVALEITEQTVSLEVADEVSLVEVSSEQGIRLMLLEVETPVAGPVEQSASVELSEGRLLQVSLDHGALRPRLHMLYQDPSFNEVAATASPTDAPVQSPKSKVQSPFAKDVLWTRVRRRWADFGHWTLDIGPWTLDIGRIPSR